jgi:hypothetical protein
MLPLGVPWECLRGVGKVENYTHLFLHCPCVLWVGVSIVIFPSLSSLFELVKGPARNGKIRRGFLMIWHGSLWSIWKARNSTIFATDIFSPKAIVEEIKFLGWKWSLVRFKMAPCMFYEWAWDPGDCLLR